MVKDGYKETEVGIIPEDWETVSFDDCFKILSNNTFARNELNEGFGTIKNIHYGDILIKFSNIIDNCKSTLPYIGENYVSKINNSFLQDGDLIIADTAEDETVGKACELIGVNQDKIVSGLHTIPCRPKVNQMFASKWLGYYINSTIYHSQLLPYITGTKVSAISKVAIKKTVVLVPPKIEQQKIADALSDIDNLISSLEKLIEKKKTIKQACLQKMFPKADETVPEMRLPGFTEPWEQCKLSEVVSVYDGVHQTPDYKDSGIMFLSVENIATLKSEKYISEEAFKKDYKVYPQKGDILMTRIGDVGTPNVVETAEKLAFYVSLALLKPNGIDSYFLCNAIQSPLFQKGLKDRTLVTAIPQKINKDEIGKVDLVLPTSTEEQRAIGAYFTNIDRLITLHQRKLEKCRKIKEGMMQQLLTGKIRLV